jgi:hypothetical protein
MARPLSEAHAELQLCAAAWEPEAKLLGNVTAPEIECLMNEMATQKRDLTQARAELERAKARIRELEQALEREKAGP